MKRNHQIICSALFYIFFAVYLILLLHALIFQRIGWSSMRSINLIPFYTIGSYVLEIARSSANSRFAFDNLFFNVVFFIPLGMYLPILQRRERIIICLSWIVLFSITVEILQWCFRLGAADIDDVILNSLGGLIGLLAYKALLALLKEKQRVRLFITIISAVAGIPALYMAYRYIF